jgi:hypothetical protein
MKRLALAFALTILASTPATAHAGQKTPFDLSGYVHSTTVPNPACRGLHNTDTGDVVGPPLGRARFENSECIDVLDAPGSFYIHEATFVLRNGSGTLTGTYTARGGLPNSHLHVYVWGPLKIIKGTGRYRRLTGTGVVAADVDLTTNIVYLVLTGTLTT